MGVWRSPSRYRAERERFAQRMGVPPELVADVANVREEADGIDGDFEVHRFLEAVPHRLPDKRMIRHLAVAWNFLEARRSVGTRRCGSGSVHPHRRAPSPAFRADRPKRHRHRAACQARH